MNETRWMCRACCHVNLAEDDPVCENCSVDNSALVPADHGTPNTGDERAREVEAVAQVIFAAFCRATTYRRVSGEWAGEAARQVLDRARDGTVAVEDAARLVKAARAYFREFDHLIGDVDYPERRDLRTVLAEFGVSERIHDQATKEGDDERRH